jgi:hypothetical protein
VKTIHAEKLQALKDLGLKDEVVKKYEEQIRGTK